MNEETKKQRESLVTAKFNEVQKILFTAGLSIGELSSILGALSQGVNNVTVNMVDTQGDKAESKQAE